MRRLAALLCPPLLTVTVLAGSLGSLAACGGGDADTAADPSGSASASGSAASAGSTGAGGGDLPTVSGAYGDKPTVTVPDADPDPGLRSAVLSEGQGPAVASGDLLVVDYLGQIWAPGEPEIFDNSYDRGVPTAFPIGTGGVIAAWDEVLVGVKAGSRVLMSVPPDKGYGEQGNPPTIEGTDTLVFVVDVIASYNSASAAALPATPTGDTGAGGVTVTGEPGAEPAVTIPPGTTPPAQPSVTVLHRGQGEAVPARATVAAHVVLSSWDGTQRQSSWATGPQPLDVGNPDAPTPLDVLVGVPVGSRVLLLLPPSAGQDPAGQDPAGQDPAATPDPATASVAAVIDVLGAHGPATDTP